MCARSQVCAGAAVASERVWAVSRGHGAVWCRQRAGAPLSQRPFYTSWETQAAAVAQVSREVAAVHVARGQPRLPIIGEGEGRIEQEARAQHRQHTVLEPCALVVLGRQKLPAWYTWCILGEYSV